MPGYGDLFEDDSEKIRANFNLQYGIAAQPDTAARDVGLAQRYGLPKGVIEQYRPDYEAKAKTEDAQTVLAQSPKLRGWLAESQANAEVSHDDLPNMGKFEYALKYLVSHPDLKNTLMGDMAAGLHGANRGAAGMGQAATEVFAPVLDALEATTQDEMAGWRGQIGGNPLRRLAEGFAARGAQADARSKELSPAQSGVMAGGVSSGIQSLTQNVLTMPAALMNPAAALLGMAGLTGGQSYQDAREKGKAPVEALPFAASQAVVEYATEKIPMSKLLGDLATNASLRQLVVHQLASEIPGEQVATVLQDLNEWATLHPEKPFKDYLAERPGAALQTLIATVVGTGGNIALMKGLDSTLTSSGEKAERARQADAVAQAFERINQVAAASKVLQRSPESFETFVAQAVQDAPVQDVFVSAQTLQQSGVAEQLAQVSPSVAEQFKTALAIGGDIRIPVDEYATRIAPTEFAQSLVDHLKTEPGGMSRAEAQTFMETHAEDLKAQVEQVLAEKQDSGVFAASAEAVKTSIRQQLDQTGRFTGQANDAYASMVSSFYTTQAARLGVTPEELLQRYPLTVRGRGDGALNQAAYHGTPHRGIEKFDTSKIGTVQKTGEFYQQARGSFAPDTNTISLLKTADLSTFLHESGHFFLHVQFDMAARLEGQAREGAGLSAGEQQVVADAQALLRWFGMGSLDEWYALDIDGQRDHHEKFARGFEAYLFDGKAPAIEMHGVFQRFRAWMVNVYKELKALNVELTDDVRSVMDRMLASEEAIKTAEQARSLLPLFASPQQAGMTEEEFHAYQLQGADATADAVQELQGRAMRDMAWIHNAKGREVKRLQKAAAAQRREVRIEATREVMSQPVYRAWQFLTNKLDAADKITVDRPKSDPNVVDPAIDSLLVAVAKLGGVNRESARTDLGVHPDYHRTPSGVFGKRVFMKEGGKTAEHMVEALVEEGYLLQGATLSDLEDRIDAELHGKPQHSLSYDYSRLGARPGDGINREALGAGRLDRFSMGEMGLPEADVATVTSLRMTAKEGLHPDVVAEMFGFSSGDELVRSLAATDKPREAIDGLTDQMMLERFGDLSSPEAIDQAADRAIHNDARARMVATEMHALEKATGKRKTLGDAARAAAASMVARLKVRNIRPDLYSSAVARAARAAVKAQKAGDIEQAAVEKRNELVNLYATKAAHSAREEMMGAVRYLRAIGESKTLPADYLDQIKAILERYELRQQSNAAIDKRVSLRTWVQSRLNMGEIPAISEALLTTEERRAYKAQIEARDDEGNLVYPDDDERIKLLADAIEASERRPFKDLSVEEVRGLVDLVKQIEHLGRLKDKMMTAADGRTFTATKTALVAALVDNAKHSGKNVRTDNTWIGSKLEGLKQFGASHIKPAIWMRIFDGGEDNGPWWSTIVRPANERAAFETTRRAQATEQLMAILGPVLKDVNHLDKIGKGRFFTEIGTSLNWEERFAIACNYGNESNLQRLKGGGIAGVAKSLTDHQVQTVLRSLTAAEWNAVQAVWDHFETYRPEIGAKELRVNGKEPEWIAARPFEVKTADGQTLSLRGGYFPVKFDPKTSLKAQQHADSQAARDAMKAAYSAATTQRSFTKERVEEVTGRPLLLNLQGLYSGVNDVIHDLAWHEWVIDMNRLMRSTAIDEAMREHYGPNVKRELTKWRDDIVAGSKRLDHGIENAAGWARKFVSSAALTYNVMSAMLQPLGITQSFTRVGTRWVGQGVAEYLAGPVEATKRVREQSEFMRNRSRTMWRDINELRNRVDGQTTGRELMGRYGYFLTMQMQMTVDVPTWIGAHNKALAAGMDEATAVALADQAVKDSQGGGEEVDQAGITRGGPMIKLFTAFYDFMNTQANVLYLKGSTAKSRGDAFMHFAMVAVATPILAAALKDALTPGESGDWDDWEKALKKMLSEGLNNLIGLVAFGREFAIVAKKLTGEAKGQSYTGPTGLRVIGDAVKLADQAHQGEFDDAFRKAAINAAGDLSGIPAVQVNRTITGAKAMNEGKTSNPAALVFGFQEAH